MVRRGFAHLGWRLMGTGAVYERIGVVRQRPSTRQSPAPAFAVPPALLLTRYQNHRMIFFLDFPVTHLSAPLTEEVFRFYFFSPRQARLKKSVGEWVDVYAKGKKKPEMGTSQKEGEIPRSSPRGDSPERREARVTLFPFPPKAKPEKYPPPTTLLP